MKTSPFSFGQDLANAVWHKHRLPQTRLLTGLALTLALLAGGQADAAPIVEVTIGSMNNFQTSSNVKSPGKWTLGDKDFFYLSRSGSWSGVENIQLTANNDPLLKTHQFLVSNLSSYSSPISLSLGYQVHINGALGTQYFYDARMGQNSSGETVEVWQDLYGSLADFNANTAPGSGTLSSRYSLNGFNPPVFNFAPFLTDIWVRNTFTLSTPGGQISSMGDTFRQVPEIDPNSFGSALSLALGALAVLERRARRLREICLG